MEYINREWIILVKAWTRPPVTVNIYGLTGTLLDQRCCHPTVRQKVDLGVLHWSGDNILSLRAPEVRAPSDGWFWGYRVTQQEKLVWITHRRGDLFSSRVISHGLLRLNGMQPYYFFTLKYNVVYLVSWMFGNFPKPLMSKMNIYERSYLGIENPLQSISIQESISTECLATI